MLSKFRLLDLINDPNTTNPVKASVTSNGSSQFLGHYRRLKLFDPCCIDPSQSIYCLEAQPKSKHSHITVVQKAAV
jgi:hypothetical protein